MLHPKLWQLLEMKPWMNFSRSVILHDKFRQLNMHTFTCKWQLTFPNTITWKTYARWTTLSGAAFAHFLSVLLCWNTRWLEKKNKSCIKNVRIAKLHTSEISKVSLWPLLYMNNYKSLITCSHAVFHWTLSRAVAGYSVFLFLSFRGD